MLEKIFLKNFKAFKNAGIKISPITLIVGPNNSGKSSLIQAINLIQQTLIRNSNNYALNTFGSDSYSDQNIDAGSFKDILNNSASEETIVFKIIFSGNYVEFSLKGDGDRNVFVSDFRCKAGDLRYSLTDLNKNDYNAKELDIKNPKKFNIEMKKFFDNKDIAKLPTKQTIFRDGFYLNIHSISPLEDSLMNYYKDKIHDHVLGNQFVPDIDDEKNMNEILKELFKSRENYIKISDISYRVLNKLKEDFTNIKYIGPIRKSAERFYSIASYKDLGFSGEHAPQVLATDQILRNNVEKYFKKMGIGENIQIFVRNNQKSFEFKIKTLCSSIGVNFKDVGCGTSQILPILVQSLMAKEDSLVMLEQPEVHLHPRTQAELADFFTMTSSENKRFLIETHSDYLIERFRLNIANGLLNPKDLSIYYIKQDPKTKETKVIRVKINEDGRYINIPDDYITNFKIEETKNITKKIMENLSDKMKQKGENV